jgi:hypothetical protein
MHLLSGGDKDKIVKKYSKNVQKGRPARPQQVVKARRIFSPAHPKRAETRSFPCRAAGEASAENVPSGVR